MPDAKTRIMTGGTQTAGIAVGGVTPPNTLKDTTALYDGSSWPTSTALGTARYGGGGGGTQTAAIAASGSHPYGSANTATEEFTGAGADVVETIDVT